MRVKVIANPMSRTGRTGKRWPEIEAKLREHVSDFDLSFTTARGDGTPLARQALAEGFDHFVAVGGDGTVNEVLNGICDDGAMARPGIVLCPVPAGTANELCRAVGILEGDAAYRSIANGRVRRIDMMRTECPDLNGGSRHTHYAFVAASFGSASEISYRTSRSRFIKKLGGEFSYYVVTILVTMTWKARPLTVVVDNQAPRELLTYAGLACNTEHTGGGMRIAPGAAIDDGILDLVHFGDMKRRDILLNPPSWLFEGHHVEHPEVQVLKGRHFRFSGDDSILVDADGETVGRLPLTVEVLPQALAVKC